MPLRFAISTTGYACLELILLILTRGLSNGAPDAPDDPFAFFRPTVVVTASDRQRLDRGDVLVRVVPARGGQLAVFAASALNATPEMLATRIRAIADLKKSALVS